MHISSQIASSISTSNLKSNPPAASDSVFKHALVAASQTAAPSAPASSSEKKNDRPKTSTEQAVVPAHQLGTLPAPVPVVLPQSGASFPDNGSSPDGQVDQPESAASSSALSFQSLALPSANSHLLQSGVDDIAGQASGVSVASTPTLTPPASSVAPQSNQRNMTASVASAEEGASASPASAKQVASNQQPAALPTPSTPGADLSAILNPASPSSAPAPSTDGTAPQPSQSAVQQASTPADPAALLASAIQPVFIAPPVLSTISPADAGKSTSNAVAGLSAVKSAGATGKPHAPSSDVAGKRKVDESDTDLSDATSAAPTSPVAAAGQPNHSASNQQSAANDPAAQQALQTVLSSSVPAHTSSQTADPTVTSGADISTAQIPVASKPEVVAAPALSSAQLIQSMHGSEMRLGMHSSEFGSISINTSLSHQVLSAQISTDHSELSRALAIHMPAIQEKLGSAYGIQAKVEVHDSSSASSGESARQSNSQHNDSRRQGHVGSLTASPVSLLASSTANSSSSASVASSDARLDIRI